MSVIHCRTKRVFFRVSEEEFQQLFRMCNSQARSVSEVARLAVFRLLSESASSAQENTPTDLQGLETKILELQRTIDKLVQTVGYLAGERNGVAEYAASAQAE